MTVFEYLQGHPNATSGEIARAMGKKTPAVASALSQLYATGRIVKSGARSGTTGDAKSGLAWIYNTLFGPGELPDESEKDAQAYFNRKYAPIDEKLMALHKWFWEQSEAERAAGIRIKGE